MKKGILKDLFLSFAKIGMFTFGGGYAMIALIENECVENKKWITTDDLSTITAIAESTPGPIAINCATFTGYMQAGLAGAISATLGMITPSFLIIYLISMFFDNFLEITIIASAFKGIKIAVGVLIFQAAVNMIKKMKKKLRPRLFMIAAFVVMMAVNITATKFSTIWLLIIAAVSNVAIFQFNKTVKAKGAGK
ncbi:MAG: chromate transporter [Oscillospiraceae bacterium]|nr:chromate transporter [Oscillospiraceae bacterium]